MSSAGERQLTTSDEVLMRRVQTRDEAAFEALFARYETAILRHVARTVRDPKAAEDLVQEVFLRVWTRADQWQGRGTVKSWLYTIATNLTLNHLRSLKRRPQTPLEPRLDRAEEDIFEPAPRWLIDPKSVNPDERLEKREEREQLWQLIETLPPQKRAVFRLVHRAELSLNDVADRLGIPEGTVKSRLYYGLKSLARMWDDFDSI
jgi:RNA polymerase sigma-70 factor (ECF subfamily)